MNIPLLVTGRRVGAVVAVVAVVALAALAAASRGVWQPPASDGDAVTSEETSAEPNVEKQVPVVLTPAREMEFERRIVASGTVATKNYALVSARIPGTLDAVFVDEGDQVEAGKTQLFQTDSLKLTKAVAIARHDLEVAKASVKEKRALLAKHEAAKRQALNDVNRYRELLKSNAVPAQVAEQQETHFEQSEADVQHTQALIDLAQAQVEQARLNLTIAEKDLADSLVVAPITGWVSERFREPGEMAAAGTPVLRIEDLSVLEVTVFLPAEYYASVVPGKTQMRVRIGDIELGDRPISYKSPTVEQKMRTFEAKGLAESPPQGVVPGCLAEVTIILDSRTGVGVPAGAVQTRGGRSVLFTIDEQRAQLVPVQTGRELGGWLEIREGLNAGTPVVTMGQTLVEDGTFISIVEEDVQ
jgi:RND family efflux transporter MFP subunit